MDGMLQPPSATAFDAAASLVSLLVYLGVACAALARAPRDVRARSFLAIAVASAVPYALSPLQWWKGIGVYSPMVIALASAAFAAGAAALFHFTQVFPQRRPFIARHFLWVALAYLVPVPVWGLAWSVGKMFAGAVTTGSGGLGAVSPELSAELAIVLLVLVIPALLLVGVLLPVAGLLSLVKSWREAKFDGRRRDRSATLWMLVSQLGGGVLAILVLPMLHLIGVGPPWSVMIAALSYGFALLLPLAFAGYALSISAG
jgi:hypothetical protein